MTGPEEGSVEEVIQHSDVPKEEDAHVDQTAHRSHRPPLQIAGDAHNGDNTDNRQRQDGAPVQQAAEVGDRVVPHGAE